MHNFALQTAIPHRDSDGFLKTRYPKTEPIGPIPICTEDMFIGINQKCEELAFSPNNQVTRVGFVACKEVVSIARSMSAKEQKELAFSLIYPKLHVCI
jgi:hypothetical protein